MKELLKWSTKDIAKMKMAQFFGTVYFMTLHPVYLLVLTLRGFSAHLHGCSSHCDCEQIPLDQVHKYLELLNRQQDEDDRCSQALCTSDSAVVASSSSLVVSTSDAVTSSLSSTAPASEKTDVICSPASDNQFVTMLLLNQLLLHCVSKNTTLIIF